MNARLYDPALGRFLAPDPFVQMPDLSQNFNRYSYAMNNPLRYVDEDGEFIHIIIGAVIGGTANLIYKAVSGQLHSFKDGFAAFGIGAAAGGLGAATGDWPLPPPEVPPGESEAFWLEPPQVRRVQR